MSSACGAKWGTAGAVTCDKPAGHIGRHEGPWTFASFPYADDLRIEERHPWGGAKRASWGWVRHDAGSPGV